MTEISRRYQLDIPPLVSPGVRCTKMLFPTPPEAPAAPAAPAAQLMCLLAQHQPFFLSWELGLFKRKPAWWFEDV